MLLLLDMICGPTTSNNLNPFKWSTSKCKGSEKIRFETIGQVDEYNFDWVEYNLTLW